jgi:ribosomal protein S12 methylthiotransferase accessory factor
LSKLGVQIAKRSPKLTITLVNDYLDRRLAEMNRERVADKTPWLLVQPSGVFPLVGPVFKPGESACWNCLFDRMIRNREIKGFLDRGAAQAVAVSPLVHGRRWTHRISLRCRRNCESDCLRLSHRSARSYCEPRSDGCGHRQALCRAAPAMSDLREQETAESTPGGDVDRDRRRQQAHHDQRWISHRDLRATVARFRKHVSPLTGVVTRLERIEVDLPMNTNFFAYHNFSRPAHSVDQLRSGLSGGSFGKGSTAEQGEASALMEAIERYSGIFQGDEIRTARRFTDFAPGDAIHPNDVQLFSEAQFQGRIAEQPDDSHPVPEPLDPSTEDRVVAGLVVARQAFQISSDRSALLLLWRLPYGLQRLRGRQHPRGSHRSGLPRTDRARCLRHLVVQPAAACRARPQAIRRFLCPGSASPVCDAGRRLWVLDVTSDLGIPTYVAIMHWMQNGHENIEFGSGAHFDRRIALLRSLTELTQFMSIGMMGGGSGEKPTLDGVKPLRLEDYPFLIPSDNPIVPPAPGLKVPDNTRDQVNACVEIATQAGYDFLVLDQTRPDVEVPVVRVLVPGLRHFYRRFAPGRLYDVPVRLGLLDRPRLESELTPFLPHT